MNRLFLPATVVFAISSGTAFAASVSAVAINNVTSVMTVGDGGSAPDGLDVSRSGPTFDFNAQSAMDAIDSVHAEGSDVYIAGLGPDDPSSFTGFNQTTRNFGTEGAFASYGFQPYGVSVLGNDGDGFDYVEHGVSGGTQAQANITTDIYDTDSASFVASQRTITFENTNARVLNFDVFGVFQADFVAQAEGADSSAFSSFVSAFSLSSIGALDVSFGFTSPFDPVEVENGAGALASVSLINDPLRPGIFGLETFVRADSSDPAGIVEAQATADLRFVLGITLQPGQIMHLSKTSSYTSEVSIAVPPATIPLPAGLPLLGIALLGFAAWGRRSKL